MNKILQFTAFLALAVPILGCRNEKPVVQELTPVMEAALNDPSSRYYADFANYPENISQLPIGIFDSDTNEMFVLVRLLNLDEFDNITGEIGSDGIPDLAGEDFIVLASPELKDGNDALTNALQLVRGDDKSKIIMAGGNLDRDKHLADIMRLFKLADVGVEVVDVIKSGVRELFETVAADEPFAVGLLAETATIELESFNHEIAAAAAERGFTKDINVITQSITDGDGVGIPVLEDALRALVEKRREMVSSAPLKAIFIGELDQDKQNRMNEVLNHFRNIRINGVYPYRSIISDKIAFIDPAKYAAMDCYRILRQNNNLSLRITEPVVKVITMPKDTIFQAVDTLAVPADTIPETSNGAGQGEMKPSAAIDAVAPAPASAGSTKVAEPISQKAVEELLKY